MFPFPLSAKDFLKTLTDGGTTKGGRPETDVLFLDTSMETCIGAQEGLKRGDAAMQCRIGRKMEVLTCSVL
jgi:hypothetical protein